MIAAWAAPFIGVPFKPHGRDPEGWDCYGCVYYILRVVFNRELPDYVYAHASGWGSISAAVREGLVDWTPVPDPQPGDGLVLRLRGLPLHVGLVVDTTPLTMLHVLEGIETVCQRLDTPLWAPRVIGVYRWTPR